MKHQIAVIGVGCYYPGAKNKKELWGNILSRRRQFREMPKVRLPISDYYDENNGPDKTYSRYAAVIDGFQFDWSKNRIPKSTYESSDIVHWLALDVATQALADAGYTKENIPKTKTGVLLGNSLTGEFTRSHTMRIRWPFVQKTLRAAGIAQGLTPKFIEQLEQQMESIYKSVFPPVTEDSLAGWLSNTIAGRICNFYDFRGGGYVVDGACSSSLLAVATAADKLVNGDLDIVLAGGVDISLDPMEIIGFAKAGALTNKDMNVYDRNSSGFIPGEGCGFLLLKRFADARRDGDYIYAVINGWGISSDGKGGITAPKSEGQALALRRAYEMAGYSPHELDFIEGHGTGTVVGDRIELEAIASMLDSFGKAPNRSCGVTSFKSLVGHTKAAAGIGGLIKAVLSVNQRILAPTAACKEPNDIFSTNAHNIYPIIKGEIYESNKVVRAGVSAMGFGGINCHITLESGDQPDETIKPETEARALMSASQDSEIIVLTADTPQDLNNKITQLKKNVKGISIAELLDLSYHLTKQISSKNKKIKMVIVTSHPDQLLDQLNTVNDVILNDFPTKGNTYINKFKQIWISNEVSKKRIGFLYPGQGSQKINMATQLIERYPWAREIAKSLWSLLPEGREKMIRPLEKAMNKEDVKQWEKELRQTEIAQPTICLASVLWTKFLEKIGITPQYTAGHSLGELVAFYAAGGYNEKTLFQLATTRGKAMATSSEKAGTMLSLQCDAIEAERILEKISGYAVVANINSPKQTIISGEQAAIAQASEIAKQLQIQTIPLPVSNAFHSDMVEHAANTLQNQKDMWNFNKSLHIPVISGNDGEEKQTIDPIYFANQVIKQVNFISVVKTLKQKCDLLLEVGSGKILTGLVETNNIGIPCLPVESKIDSFRDLHDVLAMCFIYDNEINWEVLFENRHIQPFIPAYEREFIVNPCELPLDIPDTVQKPLQYNLITGTGLPTDLLIPYLEQRGDFIHDVIQADLKHFDALPRRIAATIQSDEVAIPQTLEEDIIKNRQLDMKQPIDDLISKIIQLAADRTGFPENSIQLEHRLLDDLNLDSIKATELVASIAKEFNISNQIDPTIFANAMLKEIVQAIESVLLPTEKDTETANTAIDVLLNWVVKLTGFPRETLTDSLRLLDDLNLDSIKSAELVANVAKELGISHHIDPNTFANATLSQIAEALQPYTETIASIEKHITKVQKKKLDQNWVRNFSIEYVPCPKPNSKTIQIESNACFLIISDEQKNALAIALAKELNTRKIRYVQLTSAEVIKEKILEKEAFSHLVMISPETENEEDIQTIIRRLQTVVKPVKQYGYQSTITFIQYGGGFYGTQQNPIHLSSSTTNAFGSSLHLERPTAKIRVIDLCPTIRAKSIVKHVLAEIMSSELFISVGYDKRKIRRIAQAVVHQPNSYPARSIKWTKNDVILVTGGGQGITAECALHLARTIGVKMVLVGRTAINETIQNTLNRYAQDDLEAHYFSCDITDQDQINQLVHKVEAKIGKITGIIHGAGIVKSRRAEQVSENEFIAEIAPKLMGAIHLCKALENNPPKLFMGLTSITGVTGMAGNTAYGFANEALQLVLRKFEYQHPTTQIQTIAYSVWDEVGMGTRDGSINYLKQKGVFPIPLQEGVTRFTQLFQNNPGEKQIVVAAKIDGLDTWYPQPVKRTKKLRYIEKVVHDYPGIALIAETHLDLTKDPYVQDHVFNGSHLFPTVFGLEAMAQAASYVTGIEDFTNAKIKNIQLQLPIVLHTENGINIQIRAEVLEDYQVKTEIRTEQTGFAKAHFSATFAWEKQGKKIKQKTIFSDKALPIDPKTDLYGSILFQGPKYQRINEVYTTSHDTENHTGQCLFTTTQQKVDDYLLGDPYYHDTLLQSGLLITTQDRSLPVEIESFERFSNRSGTWKTVTTLHGKSGSNYIYSVDVVNNKNQIIQQLKGYKTHIIDHISSFPTADELASLTYLDEQRLNKEAQKQSKLLSISLPTICIAHLPNMHQKDKTTRHDLVQPLFDRALNLSKLDHKDWKLVWDQAGKPVIFQKGQLIEDKQISFSHDDEVTICTLGDKPQGCDIIPMDVYRDKAAWLRLFPSPCHALFQTLLDLGQSVTDAGYRVWTAMEAVKKASQMDIKSMEIGKTLGDGYLFLAKTDTTQYSILTLPIQLSKPNTRMVAITVDFKNSERNSKRMIASNSDSFGELHPDYGFVHRFPLTFPVDFTIGRHIDSTSYAGWMGKIRELALTNIRKQVRKQFATGSWGMITNFMQTEVVGEAGSDDIVEVHMQIENMQNDSYMEAVFYWYKVQKDNSLELIATSRQGLTWVEIIGSGVERSVKISPMPNYLHEYLYEKLMVTYPSKPLEAKKDPILSTYLLGNEQFVVPSGPNNRLILNEAQIDTSLKDSDLVGNIFFANYAIWQTNVRDQFFYRLAPSLYQGTGEQGEWITLNSSVHYLREAVPFDHIEMEMSLKKSHQHGVTLFFEFYKTEHQQRQKLAYGEQDVIWVNRDTEGNLYPTNLPNVFSNKLTYLSV